MVNGVYDTINSFACNFAKCLPILKILLQADSRYICNEVAHHNSNAWLYTTLRFIINHNTYFRLTPVSDIHISQNSVATYLRCDGIFKYQFVIYH